MSKPTERRTQFVESPDNYAEKYGKSFRPLNIESL